MMRFISTIILAVLMILGVWKLSIFSFQVLIWIFVAVGLWEFGRLVLKGRLYERGVQWMMGVFFAGLLLWHRDLELVLLALALSVFISFLMVMWKTDPLEEAVHRLSLILVGVLYLSATLPFWSWLKEFPEGYRWVFLALLPACLTDTFAFLVGKTIGKHKFAPLVSPNKSWEGFAGALFGAFIGTILAKYLLLPALPWIHVAGISLGLWIVAPLGDLAESLIKRSVHVKDASHLIPGHGGALDRLDALIFAAPFVYGYCKYIMGII